MNRSIDRNEKGAGTKIFQVKKLSREGDQNGNGNTNEKERYTTAINAQGDTGANCSATDTIGIIHNYVEFPIPQEVKYSQMKRQEEHCKC
jgi:hypothetical protein